MKLLYTKLTAVNLNFVLLKLRSQLPYLSVLVEIETAHTYLHLFWVGFLISSKGRNCKFVLMPETVRSFRSSRI